MRRALVVATLLTLLIGSSLRLSAQSAPNDALAREILKELIEINTTDTPAGNVTKAAEAMSARLKSAYTRAHPRA